MIQQLDYVEPNSVRIEKADDIYGLHVSFDLRVLQNLAPDQENEHGVRGVEKIHACFSSIYPDAIPYFFLREDFSTNFPHINPFKGPNGWVSPCFFYGSNANLLAQPDGIIGVIDRLHEWLHDAALGNLINENDGWEPQRRDELDGMLICNFDEFLGEITDDKGSTLYQSRAILDAKKNHKDDGSGEAKSLILFDYKKISNDYDYKDLGDEWSGSSFSAYENITILAWSDAGHIIDSYSPNNVSTLENLLSYAGQIGCEEEIKSQLDSLVGKHQKKAPVDGCLILGVILAVRRPYNLLGKSTSIEFLPYMLYGIYERSAVGHYVFSMSSEVKALGHRHRLDKNLLATLNGTDDSIADVHINIFGCGSVGSKITSHLIKGGVGKYVFYDNSVFSPHNSARHIFEDTGTFSGTSKAKLMADFAKRHGVNAIDYSADIPSLLASKLEPMQRGRVIDATASPHVADSISSSDWLTIPSIQVGLFNKGRLGYVIQENLHRTTRVADIRAILSDSRIDDTNLADHMPANDTIQEIQIGEGCNSATMVVADDVISEFSSGMSRIIKSVLKQGDAPKARLWLGYADAEMPGINWKSHEVGTFRQIERSGWKIRISEQAQLKMNEIALSHGSNEFGGILFGAVSITRRRIIVTRVLDAPEDSVSSPSEFVLGTEGLQAHIKDMWKRSGKELNYLGTWHSHPRGGGPSATDRQSARRVSSLMQGAPAVILIWQPGNLYDAVVEPSGN